MLSDKFLNQINLNGLYRHLPDRKYSRHEDLYWCQNWTFRPRIYENCVYMIDTYWSGSGGLQIEVTDENFDEFIFIFDFHDVIEYKGKYITAYGSEHSDWWCLPIDSGGVNHMKYFISKHARLDTQAIIDAKNQEIEELKRKISCIQSDIDKLQTNQLQIIY